MLGQFRDLITHHRKATVTMIVGLVTGPIIGTMVVEAVYQPITLGKLAKLLEDDEVSIL